MSQEKKPVKKNPQASTGQPEPKPQQEPQKAQVPEETIRCPQCGREIAANSHKCMICGCRLVEETETDLRQEWEERRQAILKRAEGLANQGIPEAKLGGFLEEDIKAFWHEGKGYKMLGKFRKVEQGKMAFSPLGLFFPSFWLAYRGRWAMSFAALGSIYGLSFVLNLLLTPLSMQGLNIGGMAINDFVVSVITTFISFFWAFYLPKYFWKVTKETLYEMGCENRPPVYDDEVVREILTAGKPSWVNLAIAVTCWLLLVVAIVNPTLELLQSRLLG